MQPSRGCQTLSTLCQSGNLRVDVRIFAKEKLMTFYTCYNIVHANRILEYFTARLLIRDLLSRNEIHYHRSRIYKWEKLKFFTSDHIRENFLCDSFYLSILNYWEQVDVVVRGDCAKAKHESLALISCWRCVSPATLALSCRYIICWFFIFVFMFHTKITVLKGEMWKIYL